jgi:hypothetical protein
MSAENQTSIMFLADLDSKNIYGGSILVALFIVITWLVCSKRKAVWKENAAGEDNGALYLREPMAKPCPAEAPSSSPTISQVKKRGTPEKQAREDPWQPTRDQQILRNLQHLCE